MPLDEFRKANLDNWNNRAEIHAVSQQYDVDGYVTDPSKLSGTVQIDRAELGDIRGKSLLHLQCHIGTDTVSLARLGATATGVDFSETAIAVARKLAADTGTGGRFEVSELYDTPNVIRGQFDIVYTGVGALCWLPSIAEWAKVVSTMLKPGGTLYVRDFHPMLLAMDTGRDDDQLVVGYPYSGEQPFRFEDTATYTDGPPLTSAVSYEWNHGIGDTVMALLQNGLQLQSLKEYPFAASQIMDCMVQDADGQWRLPPDRNLLPLMFSIRAVKTG
jgi:SAM-dependent methyltransferase